MTEATTALDVLAATVARVREAYPWMQVAVVTGDEPGTWAPVEAFAASEVRDPMAASLREERPPMRDVPASVVGNALLRELTLYPLVLAGYCFAGQRRVLCLGEAFEFRLDAVGQVRVRAPRFAVLPGDPLAGQPGVEVAPDEAVLSERLHSEVQGLCRPLVAFFHADRYVGLPNGWGSVLDSLLLGFTTAGRLGAGPDAGIDLDGAWRLWDGFIVDRPFPLRRRPRRVTYEWAPGETDEVSVRAGCCLWYVTDEAKAGVGKQYCTTCYLESDEGRIQRMVEWKQKVAAEREGGHA